LFVVLTKVIDKTPSSECSSITNRKFQEYEIKGTTREIVEEAARDQQEGANEKCCVVSLFVSRKA